MKEQNKKESKLAHSDIMKARERYINYNFKEPEQFNLQKFRDSEGNTWWECEFHKDETCWTDGFTTWESDREAVLKIFWTCEPDLIDLTLWDEEWTTYI